MTEPKVATITMSTELPECKGLVLHNIGKYLPIDDDIIGIKYQGAHNSIIKGVYATTVYRKSKSKDASKVNERLFYNQVTLILNNEGNHINIKLFGNGSLHLTGCKSVGDGEIATMKIWEKLNALSNKRDTVLLARDENNVYLDKDNMVYTQESKKLIGYKTKEGIYVINKREYEIDMRTKMWISKRMETKRQRSILNFEGVKVGCTQIDLLKNTKKFYKKNSNLYFDASSGLIYYENTVIGDVKYLVDDEHVKNENVEGDVIELDYPCCAFVDGSYNLGANQKIPVSVNCMNLYFNLGITLNRAKLYKQLIDMNYNVKYNPETYSGIKLLYKLPFQSNSDDNTHGRCSCTNKCTCTNITFLIFQSGNVIVTGFKRDEGKETVCSAVKTLIVEAAAPVL